VAEKMKCRINNDVVDCLRFYLMLSIHLRNLGPALSEKSLNEYIEAGENWHYGKKHIISAHVLAAYRTLPSEFLKIYDIQSLGGQSEIRFVEKKVWN
jgi:hypothetical protein